MRRKMLRSQIEALPDLVFPFCSNSIPLLGENPQESTFLIRGKSEITLPLANRPPSPTFRPDTMSTEKRESNEPESIEIRCYFVRERNALVARGQFSDLYMDYYLHLMENKLKNEQAYDQNLKDGFAALALHLASRPWNEAIAWTLSWQDPPQNYFFTGSNRDATITGRVFTEDIRRRDTNLLFSQTTVGGQPG